jgi:broad specificity phosphatase PhoE
LTRLYLLRHGEVTSHRGDVAITDDAERQAFAAGQTFGADEEGPIRVLSGETRRAKDTAACFAQGVAEAGGWLGHESPPGEDASALAARVRSFAASLVDPVPDQAKVVVAVTHSPLIRAAGLDLLGHDIGEPPWVSGLLVSVADDRSLSAEVFDPR